VVILNDMLCLPVRRGEMLRLPVGRSDMGAPPSPAIMRLRRTVDAFRPTARGPNALT